MRQSRKLRLTLDLYKQKNVLLALYQKKYLYESMIETAKERNLTQTLEVYQTRIETISRAIKETNRHIYKLQTKLAKYKEKN